MTIKKNYFAALLLLLFAAPTSVSADVIGIRTAAATGEKLTIALNLGKAASVVWSNGETQSLMANGSPQQLDVKSDSLTISTNSQVTSLYLPGNKITDLNLSDVSNLEYLFCQNNLLTSLLLTKVTELKELNCENNKLESLSIRRSENLLSLNCAQNLLKTLSFGSIRNIETLICANNQIEDLSLNNLTKLKQLWCQNNKIKTLTLYNQTELQGLYGFSNEMNGIVMGNKEKLTELWLEDNQLDSLYLATSPDLECVSINDNKLNYVPLNNKNKNALKYYYCYNNSLFFNSFPSIYDRIESKYLITAVLTPQKPYHITDNCEINVRNDFSKDLTNGWNETMMLPSTVVKTVDNTVLQAGRDYTLSRNKFTFLKTYPAIYIETSNQNYPDITLRTANFSVYDPSVTGIDGSTTTPNYAFKITKGELQIDNTTPITLNICKVNGIPLQIKTLAAGSHTIALPAGIYIVNKQTIIIP
ncbi:MAG: hypothetical protein RR386_08615 [Bacteroidaceae bacterium]